jgi:phosphate transport system substrate-binding protein
MKRTVAMILAIALLTPLALGVRAVTIKGSDTMVILSQRWAEVYMKTHPGATIQVTGGGSGAGIAQLIDGATDIAQASRPMKDMEKQQLKATRGVAAVEIPTAMDGLVIYVHEKNPVVKLTLAQLKAMYQAAITNWKDVGGPNAEIVLYSRENNSGTYTYFKERVLEGEDFSPQCLMPPGTAAIIDATAKDPNGIGFGGIGYAKGVKVLSIAADGKSEYREPTEANIASMKYPLARYLYWYSAGEPVGDVKKLVNWILSDEGQTVVAEVGYFPLPKKATTLQKKDN